ncbi:MAG: ABC-F family ATP-binding cassette domain-containing protein [bacterium]
MLSLQHIAIQFGGRVLFEDLSCVISPHDRVGLVGSNGTGKTTLLKVITGILQPDSGTIAKAKYVTVGYLPQDGVLSSGKTLYKEAESAFEDIILVQQELEEAQHNLTQFDPQSAEYHDTLEVFGELQHKLEDLDAFRMKSKVERVLMGLGFAVKDLERQTDEFSGGWQMRIALAKLLLQEPSILLLDEPTNHLDLESLQWLEEYLINYNGAIILVSHDRAFLDTLSKRTFALGMGRMEEYAGNYSFFEKERVARRELLLNAQKNQQQQIKQTQEFIDRFRYKATKARQVQSRVKQLEKIERIEVETDEDEIHFEFPPPPSSGRTVMELIGISKSYGTTSVFEGFDCKIERGDRIAVVGVNGAGKSTLARMLAGVELSDSGERTIGHNVTPSYFAQDQAEDLDLEKEALQIIDEVAEGEIRKKLRTILGSFLFHGDDVFKKVSVLSGGEKSRLALARMLLKPANFLVMDEPTNHLDMKSKKVLQEALQRFEGTYCIVSHDRSFLESVVNKVWELHIGGMRTYLGSMSDYLYKKKMERDSFQQESTTARRASFLSSEKSASPVVEKERKRIEAEQRQKLYQILKPVRNRLESVEREIERLEKEKAGFETMLASPGLYKRGEEVKKISADHKQILRNLDEFYQKWSELTEEMDQLKNNSGNISQNKP